MSSNYVQWGHVQTTDVNGGPLLLVFALKTQDEIDELQADLINQVAVLRSFAAHWNMGYQDVKGKSPLPDSSPCCTLVVISPQHKSTYTPNERRHITVKPASDDQWNKDPRQSKGAVHVYSQNDDTSHGYESYYIVKTAGTKFKSDMGRSIESALTNPYYHMGADGAWHNPV